MLCRRGETVYSYTRPSGHDHHLPALVANLLLGAQINYEGRSLERIYQLHGGPINCLLISEGFCVTGSDDKYLRIWPVDFSDFLLEVCKTQTRVVIFSEMPSKAMGYSGITTSLICVMMPCCKDPCQEVARQLHSEVG